MKRKPKRKTAQQQVDEQVLAQAAERLAGAVESGKWGSGNGKA